MDAKEKGYLSNRLSFLIKLNCAITIGFKNFVRIFSPITLFHKTTKEQALYKLCHASYRIIYMTRSRKYSPNPMDSPTPTCRTNARSGWKKARFLFRKMLGFLSSKRWEWLSLQ